MMKLSSEQVARLVGISNASLSRHIKAGKVPAPPETMAGGMRMRLWSERDIERLKRLLPKIANGRKTRYQKLRDKQQAPAGASPPQHAKTARVGGSGPAPHKKQKSTKKK